MICGIEECHAMSAQIEPLHATENARNIKPSAA